MGLTHYDHAQWADYVRGLQAPQTAATMRAHLETGCDGCGAVARRFDLVASLARSDAGYEPPAHLIQAARAAFSRHTAGGVLPPPHDEACSRGRGR